MFDLFVIIFFDDFKKKMPNYVTHDSIISKLNIKMS